MCHTRGTQRVKISLTQWMCERLVVLFVSTVKSVCLAPGHPQPPRPHASPTSLGSFSCEQRFGWRTRWICSKLTPWKNWSNKYKAWGIDLRTKGSEQLWCNWALAVCHPGGLGAWWPTPSVLTLTSVQSPVLWGGFNWGLPFRWDLIPFSKLGGSAGATLPMKSPTVAGELFSLNRNYFIELDSDDGTNIWEGENLEIPCCIWMVEINPPSSLTWKLDTCLEKGDHTVLLKVRISWHAWGDWLMFSWMNMRSNTFP